MKKRKLIVIGAGPGGYAAAFLAADLGIETTLIDKDVNPGGVCLFRGCIPSKAMLHLAKVLNDADKLKNFGVSFSKPKIDLKRVRAWKNDIVKKLTSGLGQISKQRKIEYIQGIAVFLDNNKIELSCADKKKEIIEFENAIIATGSHPAGIPGISDISKKILDSTSALNFEKIPKSMLVIGGGYIGLELATVYSAFGTKITIAEMLPGLLNGADRDLVNILFSSVKNSFESILLETKVSSVKATPSGFKVKLQEKDKKIIEKTFESVLVSAGRKPNSSNLGLENTGVKINEKGFIITDNQARTSVKNIFVWAASGRALTLGRTDGLTKLIIDNKSQRILGVGIAGPNAGDLISEGVLAIEMGANATDLKLSIHPHPTLSETIMESAEVFFGQSTHIYKPKKK
ncbi:MAG: FAD-dependent oxidoreductase [Ignavibacteria bacterium]|nr:FAD-dependent oxidoreductase [Ignavibacteria bacterium]